MTWLIFSSLTALVALVLFLPVRRVSADDAPDVLAPYKAQLADLEADLAAGRIEAEAARLARLEIERRILRIADGSHSAARTSAQATGSGVIFWNTERLVSLTFALCLAGGAAVYLALGTPGLEAAPGAVTTIRDSEIEPGGPTFGEAIAVIEERIATKPDDKEALSMLYRTASGIGDHSRAARAAERLAALQPENATYRVQLLGSHLSLARGKMSPATRIVLKEMEADFPGHPVSVFYRARAYIEDGERDEARAVLTALKDRSNPEAPWVGQVDQLLASLEPRQMPEITDADRAAVAAMSLEEREAFIRSMVARLEARLEADPVDGEGWVRLARARFELDGPEAARQVLLDAMTKNPSERATYQAILDRLVAEDNGASG